MVRNVNRTLGLAAGLALLGAGLSGCGSSKANDWAFTDAEGSIRSLSDYEGQVVVLGFTNTWCDPCLDAAVHMQKLHEEFAAQGVKVIYISAWERGDPEDWLRENGFTYGVMLNATEIARQYDVDRLPTFFVMGVDGKIIFRAEGYNEKTGQKIAKALTKHLRRHGRNTIVQGG